MRPPPGWDPGAGTQVGHTARVPDLKGIFSSAAGRSQAAPAATDSALGMTSRTPNVTAVVKVSSSPSREVFWETWREPPPLDGGGGMRSVAFGQDQSREILRPQGSLPERQQCSPSLPPLFHSFIHWLIQCTLVAVHCVTCLVLGTTGREVNLAQVSPQGAQGSRGETDL